VRLSRPGWLTYSGRFTHVSGHRQLQVGCRTVKVLSAVLTLHQPQRSSLRVELIRIYYLCHAAAAVLDKEVFPTVPLKSGMTCHFRSLDSFKRNLKTRYFANNWPPGDCLQPLWFDMLDVVRSTNFHEWMIEWLKSLLVKDWHSATVEFDVLHLVRHKF